jgi:hypothetical protein
MNPVRIVDPSFARDAELSGAFCLWWYKWCAPTADGALDLEHDAL